MQAEHSSRFLLGRICSPFKQVCKKLCTLQVFVMLQLSYRYSKIYSTQKADRQQHIVMVEAHILANDTAEFRFCEHGVMGQKLESHVRHVFVSIAFYECVDKVLC
jgi:hypothetical protein